MEPKSDKEYAEWNSLNMELTGYRLYLIWNALRFFIVGILIYLVNSKHNSDLEDITSDCCNCYFISKNPDTPPNNIAKDKRFDLSYCIPECTDCNYCDEHPDSEPDEGTCIWSGYKHPHSWYNINIWFEPSLNDVTKCGSNVSITSLYVFSKSYGAYGNFAVVIGSVYFAAMIVLLFVFKDRYDTMSIFIFIYNVVMAELFLYWLFKPYQYHRQELTWNSNIVQCEIDLIDGTAENMLTVIIFSSFGLLTLQILYCCCSCCKLCKKACCMWSHGDNRRSSITSHLIDQHGNTQKWDRDCCCYYLWITIGIIVVLIMIFFAVILIWAHIVMVQATYDRNDKVEKKMYIWIVNAFLFLSLFDMCFFPFCRKNVGSFVCHKIKAKLSAISSSDDGGL